MNKLYTTEKNLDNLKVETSTKEESNIHLYVVDKNTRGLKESEVFDSATNPDVHTIFHLVPDGLDYYQKKALMVIVDQLKDYNVFTIVDNDRQLSINQVNSIARIPEYV